MITPAQILNKYRSFEPYLGRVRTSVRDSLLVLCEAEGFALVSRIKTLESASEKIETGRFESWGGIDDLVAITVVVPTLAHERVVIEFLQSAFDQIEVRAKPRIHFASTPRGSLAACVVLTKTPVDPFTMYRLKYRSGLPLSTHGQSPPMRSPSRVQM